MVYVHLLPNWNILHIPVSQDRTRRVSYRPFWLFSTHLKCKGRNKFVSLLIMVPVVGKHCYFLKPLGASWLLWQFEHPISSLNEFTWVRMVTALQPTAGRQINSTTKTYQTTDRLLTNPLAFGQRKLHAKLDTSSSYIQGKFFNGQYLVKKKILDPHRKGGFGFPNNIPVRQKEKIKDVWELWVQSCTVTIPFIVPFVDMSSSFILLPLAHTLWSSAFALLLIYFLTLSSLLQPHNVFGRISSNTKTPRQATRETNPPYTIYWPL